MELDVVDERKDDDLEIHSGGELKDEVCSRTVDKEFATLP